MLYDNVDDFGLITSAEAKELGISNAELVRQAHRGKLERVARGVYRMPVWPYQKAAPYAIAVKSAGEKAYLYGPSVVALLELVPTDPQHVWVATSDRVRRRLGEGVMLLDSRPPGPVTYYEGVACQPINLAILSGASAMGATRAAQAVQGAVRAGYLTERERDGLLKELADGKATQ